MITDLTFEYSLFWLFPIVIGSIAAAWVLYFSNSSLGLAKKIALASLRFLSSFIIATLLLSPFFNLKERITEKPILVLIQDESSSLVSNRDSSEVRSFLNSELDSKLSSLGDKYRIKKIYFDKEIGEEATNNIGVESNLSLAIKEAKQRFYNQNIGAGLLISDGIYNRGVNPVYEGKGVSFPIYSLGMGDTSLRKDLFIQALIHNEISYLNNSFPVEVKIRARDLKGKETRLRIQDSRGKEVFKQDIKISQSNDFQNVELFISPDSIGLQKYRVSLNPLSEETETRNNYRSFNIEVLDNRKKILILGSSPHPDMAALNSALKNYEKYEVEVALENAYNIDQKPPDLYILHSPSAVLMDKLGKQDIPYWIIYGPKTSSGAFAKLSGIGIGREKSFENVSSYSNSAFNLFNLHEDWTDFSKKLPPIQSPFGKVGIKKKIEPLFYKRIKRIESGEPLWFFSNEGERRTAVIFGQGIWTWRIYNYRQKSNFFLFDELVASTVQYLTSKTKDDRFIVDFDPIYNINSAININARLYNKSLELSNDAEVELEIKSRKGQTYNFTLGKTAYAFKSNIGKLPKGEYNWTAKTQLGEEDFLRRGSFSIIQSDLEQLDLVARHNILRQLSAETRGKFFKQKDFDQLISTLKESNSAKAIQREETNISSLLNKKWIFFTLLILLSLEWGFRKFFGKY